MGRSPTRTGKGQTIMNDCSCIGEVGPLVAVQTLRLQASWQLGLAAGRFRLQFGGSQDAHEEKFMPLLPSDKLIGVVQTHPPTKGIVEFDDVLVGLWRDFLGVFWPLEAVGIRTSYAEQLHAAATSMRRGAPRRRRVTFDAIISLLQGVPLGAIAPRSWPQPFPAFLARALEDCRCSQLQPHE
eukprot:6444380-Amphidinium_carterae.1